MLVKSKIKSLWVWLLRWRYTRGFGIQSPIDYSFVRYVINEHWKYYAYSRLGKDDDWLRRKLGRLYFRIANWKQPKVIESTGYHDYLKAACKDVTFGTSTEMIIISVTDSDNDRIVDIYNRIKEDSLLIVEDINADETARKRWNMIVNNELAGVSFDLYYCGIVFFDRKRYKQTYRINF